MKKTELATIGGGCFWCLDAAYRQLKGVKSVVCGYAGGSLEQPDYQQVCRGTTGHAEVVQIEYDPEVIGFSEILQLFWQVHDPTTLNRQGADVGTQYRSIILFHDAKQKEAAERSIAELEASKRFPDPVITELTALQIFWPAEEYHQNYFAKNPSAGYCRVVIAPKLAHFNQSATAFLKADRLDSIIDSSTQ